MKFSSSAYDSLFISHRSKSSVIFCFCLFWFCTHCLVHCFDNNNNTKPTCSSILQIWTLLCFCICFMIAISIGQCVEEIRKTLKKKVLNFNVLLHVTIICRYALTAICTVLKRCTPLLFNATWQKKIKWSCRIMLMFQFNVRQRLRWKLENFDLSWSCY